MVEITTSEPVIIDKTGPYCWAEEGLVKDYQHHSMLPPVARRWAADLLKAADEAEAWSIQETQRAQEAGEL